MTICSKTIPGRKGPGDSGGGGGSAHDTCLPLQRVKLDNINDAESSSAKNSLRTLIWQGYRGLNEIITVYVRVMYKRYSKHIAEQGEMRLIWDFLNSLIWRRQWHPLQYSCLENPMDRGAWWAAVHGVAKSQTRLSDFTFTFHFHALEKEMATHSSVLAWRIPGTAEPDGLPSMGSQSQT